MQTLEQPDQRVASLYWLAFLLTGRGDPSVDAAIDGVPAAALDSQDVPTAFFSSWMDGWSRRLVIAKALAAVRGELARSARRTALLRSEKSALPPRNWVLDQDATKATLERSLLAIDLFPRCALLLSVFERVSLEDTAILLDADEELVRKAQRIGLRELTRNLAGMKHSTSAAPRSFMLVGQAVSPAS